MLRVTAVSASSLCFALLLAGRWAVGLGPSGILSCGQPAHPPVSQLFGAEKSEMGEKQTRQSLKCHGRDVGVRYEKPPQHLKL